MPGDTIGVLPSNNETLVEKLLIRLGIEAQADHQCELEISPGSNKKIPKHLPTVSTLRKIFLNHVDLHSPPKKVFFKGALWAFEIRCVLDPRRLIFFLFPSENSTKKITDILYRTSILIIFVGRL